MAINVAPRPPALAGALQTWTETSESNITRSEMDSGFVKTRRRFTGIVRKGDATLVLKGDEVSAFRDWFEKTCQGGVMPTRFKFPPNCTEQVWRFSAPPSYDWSIDAGGRACRVSFSLEQMPAWRTL